ncbi:MAG: PAS domain S-box protein [Pseudomonadota bacterium]|nr:PAS domain S-box protein [Pseudomonadota bacterium]QKK04231.1 MAG: PAS domain S-box protein [Pseudomonadota bacterium]
MSLQQDTASVVGTKPTEMMRCVVDETGEVVFASPALSWHLGSNTSEILSRPIDKIIHILSGDSGVPQNIIDIQSGFYDTALQRKGRDPLLVQSRIDNIHLPDGRRFVVFWVDPDQNAAAVAQGAELLSGYESTALELANIASRFVSRKRINQHMHRKLVRETSGLSIPRIGHISQDDGELRHFLNLSNDLLAVYRRDGSFVRVNYAFNRVLGYTDDDLRQIPFIDMIHPEDREYVCVEMNKLTALDDFEEKRVDFQARARCKDRGWRWIEWIQKSIGGHIYIIGSDITDRKQHEAELRLQEQQLSEAQKIGRMGHWYWVVKDSHIDWSDNLYEIFGVKRGEFEPSLKNIKTLMPDEDAQQILRVFRQSIRDASDCVLEFRIRMGPMKELRYIHCEGRCKTDPKSGKVKALFGIMQDITERKCHERALNEAKEAAETAYASKTRFLANMSHELRTPLNAIIGFSQMMQQQLLGPLGNERYVEYISGIRESGEHLLNLINDILDMSKIEVGKYELEIEDFNLSKLVQLAVHMIETRAHEGNIRLIADQVPENITIRADRRAIMQIMLNLMSNAVKFTANDGEVEISCKQGEQLVVITVRDTGYGIPEDKINLVTLPFEQVKSAMTRDHEGSGLGLAITKELVEMHSGTLTIKSKVGEGTSVTVLLPQNY